MMAYKDIILEKEEGVGIITLNRPDVLNALNADLISELKAALEVFRDDDEIGVVALTGAGRAFCAGVDFNAIAEGGEAMKEFDLLARETLAAIEEHPKLVIAMVNGLCLTGALELILTCDMILASEDATFGETHVRYGLFPAWGLSQRLPRVVGAMKAKELAFTTRRISAQEAERIGLVNRVAPAGKLRETLLEMTADINRNSREAIAVYKRLINEGMKGDLREGLKLEQDTAAVFVPEDREERVRDFGKGA
ncbi:enoyl-CoA hydratase/isomerase family protein [Chloroflexota bacterium]